MNPAKSPFDGNRISQPGALLVIRKDGVSADVAWLTQLVEKQGC
jgi:hypothetical protein